MAVIDSGLDMRHPDGPQYLWINKGEIPDNGKDDDGNGYIDDINGWNFVSENNELKDDNGHGTFVAGIIAAKTNNNEGIAGINPGARIMVLKVADDHGQTRSLSIFRALKYAANMGARVINISLGAEGFSGLEQIGINYAYNMGCVIVVASGNQARTVENYGPSGNRRVFTVGAINMAEKHKSNSNFGKTLALCAPGESIYSLTSKFGRHDGTITPIIPTEYHQLSGTSFAAPFVAGTASLMLAKNPKLSNKNIEDILMATATDISDQGWDIYTGAGLLNAQKALRDEADNLLAMRITDIFVNKTEKRLSSVDVYGIIRGSIDRYTVNVGRGKKPKKWQTVFGPSKDIIDNKFICRIGKNIINKKGDWTIRLNGLSKKGTEQNVTLAIQID